MRNVLVMIVKCKGVGVLLGEDVTMAGGVSEAAKVSAVISYGGMIASGSSSSCRMGGVERKDVVSSTRSITSILLFELLAGVVSICLQTKK